MRITKQLGVPDHHRDTPAVSPDGAFLAYEDWREIWLSFADGSGAISTTLEGNHPSWSPDGSRVAYVRGGNEIAVIDLDHSVGTSTSLGVFPGYEIVDAAWSPNGTHDGDRLPLRRPNQLESRARQRGRARHDHVAYSNRRKRAIAGVVSVRRQDRFHARCACREHEWERRPVGDERRRERQDAPRRRATRPADLECRLVAGRHHNRLQPANRLCRERGPVHGSCCRRARSTQITTDPYRDWWPTWAARATYSLLVETTGTGAGTVTSSPAGIACTDTCLADFQDPTSVTLTAVAAPGSSFVGWSGDCTGTGACVVPMVGYRDVFAEFNLPPPPPPPGGGGGGGFSINPDLGVSITSSNNAPAVNEVVEFRVLVRNKAPVGDARGCMLYHVAAGRLS